MITGGTCMRIMAAVSEQSCSGCRCCCSCESPREGKMTIPSSVGVDFFGCSSFRSNCTADSGSRSCPSTGSSSSRDMNIWHCNDTFTFRCPSC